MLILNMKKPSLLLLFIAFLVMVAALFYAWANWSGAREFRAALAQLEKKKESVRMEDFIPPHVPDDQNVAAAPIFREYIASKDNSSLGKLLASWNDSHHWRHYGRLADGDHAGDGGGGGSPSIPHLRNGSECYFGDGIQHYRRRSPPWGMERFKLVGLFEKLPS